MVSVFAEPIHYDAGMSESSDLERVRANDIKIVSLDLSWVDPH
jgi:hypothetical protein